MEPEQLEVRKLAQLLEVGRAMVADREPDQVLHRVLQAARDLTGARYAAMGILNDDKTGLARFLTAGIDEELRRRIGPLPRGHGILGEVIRHPEPLRLAHLGDHPRSYGFPAEHPAMETFLGVPVKIRDEVFGNLYLTEKVGGTEFSEDDEHLLVVLADWAAVAVDNARAHAVSRRNQDGLERVRRGLEATASLNREVIGRADLDRVVELIVKRGRALTDARTAVLLLVEGESMSVVATAGEVAEGVLGREAPAHGSISFDVLRAGRGQLISAELGAQFLEANPGGAGGVIVPLRSRGADVGVLVVSDRVDGERDFGPDDVVTLESFGTSAAAAIASARELEDERLALSIASSERERQRWARELHDETLQELGALNVMQESALLARDEADLRQALVRSNERVGQIIAGLQGLITELRPASLDQRLDRGRGAELVERLRSRSDLEIEVDIDLDWDSGRAPSRHVPELEAAVYRFIQEALTNVIKHAGAERARVRIEEQDGWVEATVEDDGQGFDESTAHDGFGLLGMRERVDLRSGTLTIETELGRGSRIVARFPVERRLDDEHPDRRPPAPDPT